MFCFIPVKYPQQQVTKSIMSNEELAHELHIQSQQIDALLNHYELDAQVASGEVHVSEGEKRSTFNIMGKLAEGLEQARAFKRDLQKALHASQLTLKEEQGQIQLNLFGQRAPVELLKVLDAVEDVPPLTAVLGWSYDQRPILLDFKAEETSHVLIAGNGRAGKTSLLRTMILSLALRNRERNLQLAVINARYNQTPQPYSHSGLRPFNYLPHLITPVIDNYDVAIETLQFLVEEIQYRSQNHVSTPHIVVLIDHLVDLVEVCGTAALLPLTHIIRNGAKSGVHLVLSTQRVEVAILQDIHDAYIPARFVGQVESARQAEIAADAYDTQAENLRGEGDFLAVVGQSLNHFQVAYVDDYDLHLCLERLHRSRPRALLAHRFDPRPQIDQVDESAVYEAETENLFEFVEPPQRNVVIESSSPPVAEPVEIPVIQDEIVEAALAEEDHSESIVDLPSSNEHMAPLQTTPPYTGYPVNYDTTVQGHVLHESSIFEENFKEEETIIGYENNTIFDEAPFAHENDDASAFTLDAEEIITEPEGNLTPEPVAIHPPQPTHIHQPLPPPAALLDDLDDDDLIPFEWDTPSFEADHAPMTEPTAEIPLPAAEPKPVEAPSPPPPAPAVQKNRFAAVRNLLSQIDESLPETPPQPTLKKSQRNNGYTPPPPQPPLINKSKQPPKPEPALPISEAELPNEPPKPAVATTKKFNSVIPQAQTKAKVVTSLRKPARPITKEAVAKPKPEAPPAQVEPEMEMVDYHDDWGTHTADSDSQLPPDEQPTVKPAESDQPESTVEPETATSAVKTIRVLNDEKAPPPTYPSFSKKKQKRATH